MAKVHSQFVCQQCGYSQTQWAGRCPSCNEWNTMVETRFEEKGKERTRAKSEGNLVKLSEVKIVNHKRTTTGESELDGVLGGGLIPGMLVLVAGEPGIGKSTLLTQVALNLLEKKFNEKGVLYVCGEESPAQVALRIQRISKNQKETGKMWLLEGTDVDSVCEKIRELDPGLVIVDSIQTLTTEDLVGVAGSIGQVRECAQRLAILAKRMSIPVFLVGHVTKEGGIAGPRVLEHLVDTVLWFEGERSQPLRMVRAVKNRFGPTDEVGVFQMGEKGLVGVSDPSQLLLSEKVSGVPGSVVSVVLEGTRPLLVEIQALVVPSQLAVPRRVSTGVDFARLQTLVAVLAKRAGLHIEASDIFVNVTGGVKLADRGIDLAICVAIASAFLNKPLASDVAAVGEVGLLGEVRKVMSLDKRVKEAKKLGYRVASAESGKSVEAAIGKLLKD